MQEQDFIVIGSGLSGLIFSYYASTMGSNVLILEKNDYAGGCIKTVLPYYEKDFFAELGSHSIYSSYATILDVVKGLNLSVVEQVKKPFIMWKDDSISSLFSHLNYFEMLAAPFKLLLNSKKGKSAEEYYSKVFGWRNYKNLLYPMTSAVICQDARNVSAELLLKSRPKNKSFPSRVSFDSGLSSLVENILNQKRITLKLSTEAVDIHKENNIFAVNCKEGNFYAKNVVVATPCNIASEMFKKNHNQLSGLLAEIPVHKTYAVNISSTKDNFSVKPFAYAIASEMNFRSVVSRDPIEDDEYRSFTFHCKNDRIDEDMKNINAVLGVKNTDMLNIHNAYFTLPELKPDHSKRIAEINTIIGNIKGLFLIGNYFGGLSMEDCALRAKDVAMRAVL